MPSSAMTPDIVLSNARVITLSRRRPIAQLVAVKGGRIAYVGTDSELSRLASAHAQVIDCAGQTLLPGFIDAHCHVMAYAASLQDVDCAACSVASIADIKVALSERARNTPPGQWIRGTGYDESALRERRHPSRWDLDEAVPNHPVRLNHRSGHACVLNTMALTRVGVSSKTPEPEGATIDRRLETGEPTGMLMEMDDYLDSRIPPRSEDEFRRGVLLADRALLSLGITSVQDATRSNSTARWETFRRLKAEGSLAPRVTMMAGIGHLDDFTSRGFRFGSGDDELDLGAAKVMLTAGCGTLRLSREALNEAVILSHDAGFPVAIHAVEADAVEAAVDVLTEVRASATGMECVRTRDRIEHCSECPPVLLDRLVRSGAAVVTQPGFLYYSGRRYLSEVPADMQPWLYRVNSFLDAGLVTALASDAPVIDPDPMVGIYAAVTRKARTGETVGDSERAPVSDVVRMYTLGGAYASGQEECRGSIEVGKLADLVLLDGDPTSVHPEQIRRIRAVMTMIGGEVVWRA